MKLLITYTEVQDLLMQGGLRKREARRLLAENAVPPVDHGLHSRRRWARQVVLDFVNRLQHDAVPLGKGASAAVSQPPFRAPHA